MNKVYPSVEAAVEDIPDGATVGFGGFFAAGKPTALTLALAKKGARNLTVVVMQMGIGNEELLELVKNRQVKKAICNYPLPRSVSKGANHPFEQAVRRKEVELEVYPMGTWVEKLRCAGAGLPAFYTPTGVGTVVAEGKEVRVFNGKEALLETALPLDFGFVHAFKGDPEGNLVYRYTAANYNNAISMAAEVTIAQVENVVEVGKLDPNYIHTPGIFVQRVVQVERPKFIPRID